LVTVPDRTEHRRQFAALPFQDRRAIVRAVNRGAAVEKRKHAPLAIVIARRQRRLWRYAWLFGLAVGLVAIGDGWQAAALNGLIGMTTLGLLGRFWYVRASRAEQANTALAEGKGRGKRPDAKKAGAKKAGANKADGKNAGGEQVSRAARGRRPRRGRG
jgi:hypothetical protein